MSKVEQKSFEDILDICQSEGCIEKLKQAISSGELNDELAKILPKSFYEEQGYRKVYKGMYWLTFRGSGIKFRNGEKLLTNGDTIYIEEEK